MTAAFELVRTVDVHHVDATHLSLGERWGKRLLARSGSARVYAQLTGSASLELPEERLTLGPGDLAFLPRADGHVIRDLRTTPVFGTGACPGMERVDDDTWESTQRERAHGGEMVITDLEHGAHAPWLPLLPAVVHIRASSAGTAPWLRETLGLLRGVHGLPQAVRNTLATPLGQLLFARALENLETQTDLARDAQVAAVLAEVRAASSRSWELSDLAKRAGLSRTVFVERATALLGKPVGRWVRELRLQRARELLETTDVAVKEVASRVGYANESAFARAFVRDHGVSPARFREGALRRAS
jgi:AraC-like DNA-binding protein